MSGLPPTGFDFGEPCLACSPDPKGTPLRYKLEFSGMLIGIPGTPLPDREAIVFQQTGEPCFYGGPTTEFNNFVRFTRQPGGFPFDTPFIDLVGGTFFITFFKAEDIAACSSGGTFDNDFTVDNPSPENIHSGICILTIN